MPQIIAEVSFNRPKDQTESNQRIVRLYGSKTEIYLTLEIGKEQDDTINLVFPITEFIVKVIHALMEREVEDAENA